MQPGGFMQAARWSLGAQQIDSRSGEFRVTGADEAATITASQAFAADIAAALGEDFHYSEATDNLEARFIADKKKRSGLSALIGVVVAVVVAIVATPAVSAWVAGAAEAAGASAAAGSAWAAGTATASAGFANVAATSFVTGTLSSAAGQLAGTGKVDLDAALRNGAVSGLTAGLTSAAVGGSSADSLAGLSNQSGTLQPVAGAAQPDWADQLLGIGARSVVSAGIQNAMNGTGFQTALRDALVNDFAALGANRIGSAGLDTVPHALSHAALGAITAELTGKDAAAGAIGALASALAAQPIDEALGLTGTSRQAAVTALAMLSGGVVSDALGYDAVTAANAALNEVTNNYLSPKQQIERAQKLNACGADAWCQAKTALAYEILSGKQDIGLAVGIGGGIGVQSYDGVMSVLKLLEDIPGAVSAMRALIDDPAVRSQFKTELVDSYRERLARLDASYHDGGWDGSITAGVEIGRLFVDVLGVAATAKGAAQLSTTLTRSLGRDAGTLAEIGGKVADARISNNFYRDGASIEYGRSVVATNPGEAQFWSGVTRGQSSQLPADEFAKRFNSSTLNQLLESRQIQMPVYDPTVPDSVMAWIQLSRGFAQNASGEVRVVLGSHVRPDSVWASVELPTLKRNPAVTRIVSVDAASQRETVVFERGTR